METAREGNPGDAASEGGLGAGGKFRKRPFRRTTHATPYDRPPKALRDHGIVAAANNNGNGWLSRFVDPAQRLITASAHRLFSSVFRKRLTHPPPTPTPKQPSSSEAKEEVSDKHQEARDQHHEAVVTDSPGVQQGAIDRGDKSSSSSDRGGLTELEKILKQKTFSRSEIDRLTALLRSKTSDIHVGDEEKKSEVIPPKPVVSFDRGEEFPRALALENGSKSCLISTPIISARVLDEDVASPAELAKAYMGSRPSKVSPSMLGIRTQALGEDSPIISSRPFPPKSPILPILPRSSGLPGYADNGFITPRSRGKSAIYSWARTPYSRVHSTSTPKNVETIVAHDGPSLSSLAAWEQNSLYGSKQGALKRRSSVLDNDIGSVGPIRRIRHKPSLLSSRNLTSSVSESRLSIPGNGLGPGAAQHPSSSMQKLLLLGKSEENFTKMSTESGDNSMPGTSFPLVTSKSSEMASKILQQLEKLVSPKEKSYELKVTSVKDGSPTKLSPSMLRGKALRSLETLESPKFLENVQNDSKLDKSLDTLLPDALDTTSQKQNKVENGPLKLVSPCDRSVLVVNSIDYKSPNQDTLQRVRTADSSVVNSVTHPPQTKRAFQMSAHEDYLELDDDYTDGVAPTPLVEEREKVDVSVAERKTNSAEEVTLEKPPSIWGFKSPVSSAQNQRNDLVTLDGPVVMGNNNLFVFPKASSSNIAVQPAVLLTESTLTSDSSASQKESNDAPPLFRLGDKNALPNEPNAASAVTNFVSASSAKVPQFLFASSSSATASAGVKFGVSLEPKPESSSSFLTGEAIYSGLKVPELGKADNGDIPNAGVNSRTLESVPSSVASSPQPTASIVFKTTANNSILNNGSLASSPSSFSTPIPPLVSDNGSSQNSVHSSTIGVSSPRGTATTTFPTAVTSSSSLSTSAAAPFSATPIFKFGSTFSSTSESAPGIAATFGKELGAAKTSPETSFGNLSSSPCVGTSAANASAGNSNNGFSAAASSSTAINQSQGSTLFSTDSGSVFSSQASPVGTGIAPFTNSMPTKFSSSTLSPSFGLAGNAAFSSGSVFAASTPAATPFSSGAATFGFGSSASSQASSSSAIGGSTSSVFGSSWQPSKSPVFGSAFDSTSASAGSSFTASAGSVGATTTSPSTGFSFQASTASMPSTLSSTGFPFTASTPVAVTSSAPAVFGSTIGVSSGPNFGFTSSMATPSSQPVFGNTNPGFLFNSAFSGNNDQMNMEDSMAEDTVQASAPTVPVFGQHSVSPAQPGFAFGSIAPSAASPFPFGAPQNSAQNSSPFQDTNSLGGSFSVGAGGGDKAGRRIVRVSRKARKK